MFVKICGITRAEDARTAEAAGADAIGMIFVPGSKRRLDVARAEPIASAVGPFVTRVGVFADARPDDVRSVARRLRLDVVQLHGAEDEAYVAALREEVKVIKAVRFAADLTPSALLGYRADAVLLDGATPGSGVPFDWRLAAALRRFPNLVLAGGLGPENVAQAIAAMQPHAVDVASGVESAPGIKDPAKVRAFVLAAKAAHGATRGADRDAIRGGGRDAARDATRDATRDDRRPSPANDG